MSEIKAVAAEAAQCKARVFDRSGWARAHNCSNKATRDGFCGIHHPDAQAKRDQKSREKFERDSANSIYTKYASMTVDRDRLASENVELREALRNVANNTESFWAMIQGEYGVKLSGADRDDAGVFAFFDSLATARALLEARK